MGKPPMSDSFPTRFTALPSPSLAEDILNAVQTLVVVANGDGDIVYAAPAIARILGFTPEEVLGSGWWALVGRADGKPENRRRRAALEARGELPVQSEPYVSKLLDRAGLVHHIQWHDSKGPGDLLIGVGNDVSALHRAEQEIESRGQDFRAIFEGASDGMAILDSEWKYVDVNASIARIYGLPVEAIIGKEQGSLLFSSINVGYMRQEAVCKGRVANECEFTRADGQKRQVEFTAVANFRPGHHLLILRDTTDRRALERQLAQAQKLEAVGRLAGGVAHDFNNMLTAIQGYGDLLLKKVPEGVHRRYVEGILGAAERAAQTTQQLLTFSRRQIMQPKLMDLNEGVTAAFELLRRLIGEDIDLVTLLADDAGEVLFDPGQFSQVLVNLAVNARDAMPGGGKLIIETRSVHLDDEYVLKHVQVTPGDYAMLAVTDTGTGIPSEVRPHIFEPFFTTKPVGKGSGLGLSTVYGAVKQSGGFIWVYSEPGEGTTFKVYLPKPNSVQLSAAEDPQLAKMILLIEDDRLIRSLAATVLRDKGHEVWEAKDGSEALTLCQNSERIIDLVITDIGAPGMSGEDLMGFFAVRYPNVAIIHMSGFSQQKLLETKALPPNCYFLAKPFTVRQLMEKVQVALERGREDCSGWDPGSSQH
jgi:two-component system, cell cycle sensor histidine kinase and response regulator CckA